MYRAHSKDINRNKSFHPLTYGNLRRVELLKEGEDDKKQRNAERQKELQRDQEERRYDELVLANSADSLSGELARLRQTKSIFQAEYEAETVKQQAQVKTEANATDASALAASPFASSSNAFLAKFKKEGQQHAPQAGVKAEPVDETTEAPSAPASSSSSSGSAGLRGKRPREEEEAKEGGPSASGEAATRSASNTTTTTGFVTSAEAAELRRELNLAQKQRHDPLMRVRQFQNSCVANAARQQEQQQHQRSRTEGGGSSDNSDALQSRIRELLALKKQKGK